MPDDPPAGERPDAGSPAARGSADRARLAAEALARAKADARARGEPPPAGPLTRGARQGGQPPSPGAGAPSPSGPASSARAGGGAARAGRPRRDDPQPLAAAISGLLGDQGWRTAAAMGSVFGRWDHVVGPELAAHTRPEGFADGELVVVADSTAWATQVRLLAAALVRRLNEELGDGAVRRVAVRGPAPPRRSGPWRVRDGRGPRDDYG